MEGGEIMGKINVGGGKQKFVVKNKQWGTVVFPKYALSVDIILDTPVDDNTACLIKARMYSYATSYGGTGSHAIIPTFVDNSTIRLTRNLTNSNYDFLAFYEVTEYLDVKRKISYTPTNASPSQDTTYLYYYKTQSTTLDPKKCIIENHHTTDESAGNTFVAYQANWFNVMWKDTNTLYFLFSAQGSSGRNMWGRVDVLEFN